MLAITMITTPPPIIGPTFIGSGKI